MKLYKFSPIKTEKDFNKALEYIAKKLEELSLKIFNKKLPINTLKIFPHYFDEYDYLFNLVCSKGKKAPFSSNSSLYVEVDYKIRNYNIKYLGVYIVDPYRFHVGCGDFELDNFKDFKSNLKESHYIRVISDDMLEVWHPDFGILGYIVPPYSE